MFKKSINFLLLKSILIVFNISTTQTNTSVIETQKFSNDFQNYQHNHCNIVDLKGGIFINTLGMGVNFNTNFYLSKNHSESNILTNTTEFYNSWIMKFLIDYKLFFNIQDINYNTAKNLLDNIDKKQYNELKNTVHQRNNRKDINFHPKIAFGIFFNKQFNFNNPKLSVNFSITPCKVEILRSLMCLRSLITSIRKSKALTDYASNIKDLVTETPDQTKLKNMLDNDITKNLLTEFNIVTPNEVNKLTSLMGPILQKHKGSNILRRLKKNIINPIVYYSFGDSIELLQTQLSLDIAFNKNIYLTNSINISFLPIRFFFNLENNSFLNLFKVEFSSQLASTI